MLLKYFFQQLFLVFNNILYYNYFKDSNNKLIGIFTQTDDDNYSRTLEEAMLTKVLNIMVWDSKPKQEWAEFREQNNLKFSIPRDKDNITVRDLIKSSSNNKIDFINIEVRHT